MIVELKSTVYLFIIIITQVLLATQLSWIDITIGYNYLIKTSYKYNRNTFNTANHTVLIAFLLTVV